MIRADEVRIEHSGSSVIVRPAENAAPMSPVELGERVAEGLNLADKADKERKEREAQRLMDAPDVSTDRPDGLPPAESQSEYFGRGKPFDDLRQAIQLGSPGTKEEGRATYRDPWKHRRRGLRCGTCMWWVPKESEPRPAGTSEIVNLTLGRCRRRAPTMNGFPASFAHDWCGDHKLDENKL